MKQPVRCGTGVWSWESHDYGRRPKAGPAIPLMGWRRDTTPLKIGRRTQIKGRRGDLTSGTESEERSLDISERRAAESLDIC